MVHALSHMKTPLPSQEKGGGRDGDVFLLTTIGMFMAMTSIPQPNEPRRSGGSHPQSQVERNHLLLPHHRHHLTCRPSPLIGPNRSGGSRLQSPSP